jgi:glycosyltransferase involved in cell wall biosynthesis
VTDNESSRRVLPDTMNRSGADVTIDDSSFVIVTSGFADGPAQPLRDYLRRSGARELIMVSHPLVGEHDAPHTVVRYVEGTQVQSREIRLPNRPPLTYAFDPFVPLRVPTMDVWFGFNCLATGVGLARRATGRIGRVIHWSVDFVPERFGPGLLTRAYERLDELCCRRADGHVELSIAAREARSRAYGLDAGRRTPTVVIPMGIWLDETPKATLRNARAKRIVFLGHLVPRMGLDTLLDALRMLADRGVEFTADIVGGGPLEQEIRLRADKSPLAGRVTCHGFVRDRHTVEAILALGTVGVAPYDEAPDSFSRSADPGKLKAYLGAGLPIILTDVPPNARELAARGGGEIVAGRPDALAAAIERLLADEDEWHRRHEAALNFARAFDWNHLLGTALPSLGLVSD